MNIHQGDVIDGSEGKILLDGGSLLTRLRYSDDNVVCVIGDAVDDLDIVEIKVTLKVYHPRASS